MPDLYPTFDGLAINNVLRPMRQMKRHQTEEVTRGVPLPDVEQVEPDSLRLVVQAPVQELVAVVAVKD